MNTPLHVVLGAGQVGSRLTAALLAKGHRVRVVRRSGPSTIEGRLERLAGDMTDLQFAERAGQGASVVYDCMNPAYWEWGTFLLPMGKGALHAAVSADAKLVALDNLYPYGAPGVPITELTAFNPCSTKGELRVKLHALRMTQQARVAVGRASDFFGANLQYSWWSDRFFERITHGKKGECAGDPDQPHAYTWVDDIARALVTLGEREEALGQEWLLPTAPAQSTRRIVQQLGAALGVKADSAGIPRLLLKAIGLFSPFIGAAVEMAYQWDVPFLVDDSKFVRTFGYGATALDEAIAQTARAWVARR